jgi:hypothetical protein
MRILVLLFVLGCATCQAQDLLVYGKIRQYERDAPLHGAEVHLSRNGSHVVTVQCDSVGYYGISLDVGQQYVLDYRSPGRVSKTVWIDLRGVPADDGGYGMNVDVRLFAPQDGVDVSFLQEPIGKAAYDSTAHGIRWDMEYTAPRMELVNSAFPVRYTIEMEPVQVDSVAVEGE